MANAPTHPCMSPLKVTIGAIVMGVLLASCAGTFNRNNDTPRGPVLDTSPVAVADTRSHLPAGWQQGAFMEIFVRAWRDSDGDGIGDLRGVTQSLDYLRNLGVKGIWLMPITRSADGDHGYAVTDFRQLEPAYGNMADFDELLREAHARGIGVIMDYVINHSSASHPLFVEASSRTSAYRNWYVWKDPAPTGWDIWGKNPWYPSSDGTFFSTFGAHMPDFNLENTATMDFHRNSLRFWLNRGLDGFRFDAVPHLVENSAKEWNDQSGSYALMAHVNALMSNYQNRYMVCEATTSPVRWAAPYVCGSAFAFGMEHKFVDAARGNHAAITAVAEFFKSAPLTMATMLSNHDVFAGKRLWDQVKGDVKQYRLAAASYLLMPGTPFIYYGEEIGMAGVGELPGDSQLRTPMSWTSDVANGGFTTGKPFRPISPNVATQNVKAALDDPNSILSFYKAMLNLRNTLPSIARGSYEHSKVDGSVLSYQRRFQQDHSLVVINYGTEAATIEVGELPAGSLMAAAYPVGETAFRVDGQGRVRINIDVQSVKVFRLRR